MQIHCHDTLTTTVYCGTNYNVIRLHCARCSVLTGRIASLSLASEGWSSCPVRLMFPVTDRASVGVSALTPTLPCRGRDQSKFKSNHVNYCTVYDY